jgi:3-deoxy-7-phosphoheptulonate synthase
MTVTTGSTGSSVVDQRIHKVVPLVRPIDLHGELPLDDDLARTVLAGRRDVTRVLDGADDRLLVVVGPCSVHDPVAALEYAGRLALVADRLSDGLLVVMRVYFEKPRSTLGWKGLINDPGWTARVMSTPVSAPPARCSVTCCARGCRPGASSSTRSSRSTSPTA